MSNRPNVVFREKPEIIECLDKEADRRGCERSDIIREAIREKLAKVEAKTG